MTNEIQSIPIDKLIPHPDNPNRMSKANFAKLVRNIRLSGRYEPLVVRPCPPELAGGKSDCFQIINGHHRWQALTQLGYKEADAVVWDIDDRQTDILLATLNRLGGSDVLEKKLALLGRLNQQMKSGELARLLPQTAKQIERLTSLEDSLHRASRIENRISSFANPMVFFVSDQQQQIIENALAIAKPYLAPVLAFARKHGGSQTKAAALTAIAEHYITNCQSPIINET